MRRIITLDVLYSGSVLIWREKSEDKTVENPRRYTLTESRHAYLCAAVRNRTFENACGYVLPYIDGWVWEKT